MVVTNNGGHVGFHDREAAGTSRATLAWIGAQPDLPQTSA